MTSLRYGYVEYETEEALDAALLEHKDKEIEGNKLIIIKCVKEKPEGLFLCWILQSLRESLKSLFPQVCSVTSSVRIL